MENVAAMMNNKAIIFHDAIRSPISQYIWTTDYPVKIQQELTASQHVIFSRSNKPIRLWRIFVPGIVLHGKSLEIAVRMRQIIRGVGNSNTLEEPASPCDKIWNLRRWFAGHGASLAERVTSGGALTNV